MARPTTKQDLLTAAGDGYKKLTELVSSLTEEQQRGDFAFDEASMGKEAHWKRDKNIRDVLVHLYEWHQLLLSWIENNQKGGERSFLPEPYNWKTYGEMNEGFWKAHQETGYEKAKDMLEQSHNQVVKVIESFTNDELFSKGVFKWAGTNAVGSYCVSVTASHYDWAMKKIKKYKKSL